MSTVESVFKFYLLCNKLKNVIRTGWKNWNVKRDRIESVAEHIYSVQMLAIAMKSEFNYDVDIYKVIYMLAIHELGETVIGDITLFDMDRKDKERMEHEAVHQILKGLLDGDKIEELFLEFDAHQTKEAKFAYMCDKLECDLQAVVYDLEKCVDLNDQANNSSFLDDKVQKLLKNGYSFGEMWLKFGQERYSYDENFMAVSKFAMKYLHNYLNPNDEKYLSEYKTEVINEVEKELSDIGPSLIKKKEIGE